MNLMSITPHEQLAVAPHAAAQRLRPTDANTMHEQYNRSWTPLADRLPAVAEHLDDARADVRAFASSPKEMWRQIWSNNPKERLNREIRRLADVVGILPDRNRLVRLVGAVLVEQQDEWIEGCRYLGRDVLGRSRISLVSTATSEEVNEPLTPAALTAKLAPTDHLVAATHSTSEDSTLARAGCDVARSLLAPQSCLGQGTFRPDRGCYSRDRRPGARPEGTVRGLLSTACVRRRSHWREPR